MCIDSLPRGASDFLLQPANAASVQAFKLCCKSTPLAACLQVGPEVTSCKVGDRVVIPFDMGCGACMFCEQELYSLCDSTNPRWAACKCCCWLGLNLLRMMYWTALLESLCAACNAWMLT